MLITGGQFGPKRGGQFALKQRGHFAPKWRGQFGRNIHQSKIFTVSIKIEHVACPNPKFHLIEDVFRVNKKENCCNFQY